MTLLQEVERYLDCTKMTATAFGRAAANDPNLVFDLRRGREPRSATSDRVRQFIRRHLNRSGAGIDGQRFPQSQPG